MDSEPEFAWTFPVYVLARDFTIGEQDGCECLILDGKIKFATPEVAPGKFHLALFTDQDLAERFRQQHPNGDEFRAFAMPRVQIIEFLKAAIRVPRRNN